MNLVQSRSKLVLAMALLLATGSGVARAADPPIEPPGAAVDRVALELSARLGGRGARRVAVIPFDRQSGGLSELGKFLADKLTGTMSRGDATYAVVDRMHVEKALGELRLNYSHLVDPGSAQRLGEFLGADVLVAGALTEMQDCFELTVRAVSTSSLDILASSEARVERDASTQRLWANSVAPLEAVPSLARPGDPAPAPGSTSGPAVSSRFVQCTVDGVPIQLSFETEGAGVLRTELPDGRSARIPEALLNASHDLRTVYIVQRSVTNRKWYVFLKNVRLMTVEVPACSGARLLLPVGGVDIRTPGIGFGSLGGRNVVQVLPAVAGMELGPDGHRYGKVINPRWMSKACSSHLPPS